MFEILLWLTGAVILGSLITAYVTTKDPLHPLTFLGPIMFYAYVFSPGILFYRGLLDRYFPEMSRLDYVQTINLAGIFLFCAGCLYRKLPPGALRASTLPFSPSPGLRQNLTRIGCFLGFIGTIAFYGLLFSGGGLHAIYGTAKGGVSAPSGYIGEAPLMTLPAIVLLALAWQGLGLTFRRAALLLFFASPQLIHGLLGARRGPSFTILALLFLAAYLVYGKRPTFRGIFGAFGAIGLLSLTLFTFRPQIYIGTQEEFDSNRVLETLMPTAVTEGNEFIYASGLILHSKYFNLHYWGKRYAVIFLVRPIPRQIWPTKYEDTGMSWMADNPGQVGRVKEWLESVGWMPDSGSSSGFVADMYLEFAAWCMIPCFLLGLFYNTLWRRSVLQRGLWAVLYVEACALSIYVPTQSVSSWLHQILFTGLPTYFLWRWIVAPWIRHHPHSGPMWVRPPGSVPAKITDVMNKADSHHARRKHF